MRREEIDRLLARLSSGEITAAERSALYDAALEDQALFEELFAEEALADALSDEQLRDEFLIREAGRVPEDALFSMAKTSTDAIPAEVEAPAAIEERALRMPSPARPGKRRIPWWGWAVPAAVAASTVIGVVLLREPARESQVAQTKSSEQVQVAQAQPEKAAPETTAPAPARQIAAKADAKPIATPPAEKGELAASPLKKSEPVLMARRDESKIAEFADKAAAPQTVEPARQTAPAAAAPPPAAFGATQAAGRAAESEARPTPAQVAELRTAAPPPQAEGRVARDAQVRNEAVVQARAKTVAAERDDALALRSSATLQVQDASGAWQDVAPGGRVARGAKLRVKVTAHESGAWTLMGDGGRTVQLTQNESAYLDLPAQAPGLNRVELTFRPGSPAVLGLRSTAETGRTGRISIPFTIE